MKKRIFNIIILIILGLFFIGIYFFVFNKYHIAIPCFIHELTGYYCPGCGITRCILSILKLDFKKAFMYNQVVFIMLPFAFIYIIYSIYCYIVNKKNNILNKIPNYISIPILIIVIIFGIIRNLPQFPYLRP